MEQAGAAIHIGLIGGIGVAASEPLYVVKLDASRRQVVVGPRDALRARTLIWRDVNWLGDQPFDVAAEEGVEVLARIRSTGPLQRATVRSDGSTAKVSLAEGEEGVSPGQACVFYAATGGGKRLLGGGWIKSAEDGAWLAKDGFAAEASPMPAETFLAGSR